MIGSRKGKRDAEQKIVSLQQETLTAVNNLVSIQQQLLEVKKEKLELKREEVLMKKIKLMAKGWIQDLDGNWVGTVNEKREQ